MACTLNWRLVEGSKPDASVPEMPCEQDTAMFTSAPFQIISRKHTYINKLVIGNETFGINDPSDLSDFSLASSRKRFEHQFTDSSLLHIGPNGCDAGLLHFGSQCVRYCQSSCHHLSASDALALAKQKLDLAKKEQEFINKVNDAFVDFDAYEQAVRDAEVLVVNSVADKIDILSMDDERARFEAYLKDANLNFDFEVRDYCDTRYTNDCTFQNQYKKMLTGASVSDDGAGNLKVIIPSPFHMANKTYVSQAYCDSDALTDDFYFHENATAADLDGSFIATLDMDDYYCFVTEDSYYRGYKQLLALNYQEKIEAQIRSYLAYFEQEWDATITVQYMNGGFHVFFGDVTFKTFGAARRNTYTNLGSLSSVIKASTSMIIYETTSFFQAPYNNRYQWQWEAMKNEILTTGGIKYPGNLNIVVPYVRPSEPTIKSIPLYVPVAPIANEDACKDLGFLRALPSVLAPRSIAWLAATTLFLTATRPAS
jgi:hypothetical protein